MSIELPEARILAGQMHKELRGKRVQSYHLRDYAKLQKIGMLNKDIKDFDPQGAHQKDPPFWWCVSTHRQQTGYRTVTVAGARP